MTKFINIDDDTIINIGEIEGIQRELYIISKEAFESKDFQTGKDIVLEEREFTLAKVFFKSGKSLEVNALIRSDENAVSAIQDRWDRFVVHLDQFYVQL